MMRIVIRMNEKLIFSDVDEVVLRWLPRFTLNAQEKGYKVVDTSKYLIHEHFDVPEHLVDEMVNEFSSSDVFRELDAIDDSIVYARKICEDFGYKFDLITACGEYEKDHVAHINRLFNVSTHIGAENIRDLFCVASSEAKRPVLERYRDKGYVWVDDSPKNVELGVELGYESYLYTTPYNINVETSGKRVHSWQEIYEIIKIKEAG